MSQHPKKLIPVLNKKLYEKGDCYSPGTGIIIKQAGKVYISPEGLNMDMLESDDLFVFNESLDESGEPEIHTTPINDSLKISKYTKLYLHVLEEFNCNSIILAQPRCAILAGEIYKDCLSFTGKEILRNIINPRTAVPLLATDELKLVIVENCSDQDKLISDVISAVYSQPSSSGCIIKGFGLLVFGESWTVARTVYDTLKELIAIQLDLLQFTLNSIGDKSEPPLAVTTTQSDVESSQSAVESSQSADLLSLTSSTTAVSKSDQLRKEKCTTEEVSKTSVKPAREETSATKDSEKPKEATNKSEGGGGKRAASSPEAAPADRVYDNGPPRKKQDTTAKTSVQPKSTPSATSTPTVPTEHKRKPDLPRGDLKKISDEAKALQKKRMNERTEIFRKEKEMRDAALNDAALKEKKLALETLKKRSAEVWQNDCDDRRDQLDRSAQLTHRLPQNHEQLTHRLPQNQTPCKYFMRGENLCRSGNSCKFSHDRSMLGRENCGGPGQQMMTQMNQQQMNPPMVNLNNPMMLGPDNQMMVNNQMMENNQMMASNQMMVPDMMAAMRQQQMMNSMANTQNMENSMLNMISNDQQMMIMQEQRIMQEQEQDMEMERNRRQEQELMEEQHRTAELQNSVADLQDRARERMYRRGLSPSYEDDQWSNAAAQFDDPRGSEDHYQSRRSQSFDDRFAENDAPRSRLSKFREEESPDRRPREKRKPRGGGARGSSPRGARGSPRSRSFRGKGRGESNFGRGGVKKTGDSKKESKIRPQDY